MRTTNHVCNAMKPQRTLNRETKESKPNLLRNQTSVQLPTMKENQQTAENHDLKTIIQKNEHIRETQNQPYAERPANHENGASSV